LATQLNHFVDYIKGKTKPLTSVDDGVVIVEILEAIDKSLKTGKEISLAPKTKRKHT
jgi:predicted dehydrogenase